MDPNYIIDSFGGTSAVATLCEVTTGAVAQWRNDGIPRARLMYLRLLRPDLFPAAEAEPVQNLEEKRAA